MTPARFLRAAVTTAAATLLALSAATATASASATAGAAPALRAPIGAPSTIAALRAAVRNGTLARTAGLSKVCATNHLACGAEVVTVAAGADARPLSLSSPVGYGATELQQAYGVSDSHAGTGTVVVIGAGAYPTLESDLAVYRSAYHLPPCTSASGCFTQLSYLGGAPYAPAVRDFGKYVEEEIAVETALDVEMASAGCPGCKIVSIQVPLTDGLYGSTRHLHRAELHFATGVALAHSLGASAVSISYGYPTDSYSDKGAPAQLIAQQQGMAVVSSSGDGGTNLNYGQWPQGLTTVTSAGGTSLYPDAAAARGYTEVAWNGAGSGCSLDLPPAVGQPPSVSQYCSGHRAASDLSAVADPYTGVAVYDSYSPFFGEPYGYIVVGGTSVASPLIAGLWARAGVAPSTLGPNTIYAAKAGAFNDVTIGTNAGLGYCATIGLANQLCDAGPGWDGPTGRGTPKGFATFRG